MLEVYGVDNISKTNECKEKIKKTCLKKYGVEYSFQSENNKTKAKIMTSYALTNSYNATAKETGVSHDTVKNVIEANKDEFRKIQKEKKDEFVDKASEIIDKALELLKRRYNKALNNEDELEELIDIVFKANDPENDEELSHKEKLDIAKKIGRLELNNLSEITTAMGTLFDKMRLAKGEPTGNIKVSYEDSLRAVSGENDY